jgi:hypothetical protein
MTVTTKQHGPHRGEYRRCAWRSSCAVVVPFGGFAVESPATLQTNALALPNGDVRIGMGRAGPPG